MGKLRHLLDSLSHQLGLTDLRLKNARRRHRRQLRREQRAFENATEAQSLADKARAKGDAAGAAHYDRKAQRALARKERRKAKRLYLRGLVRKLAARKHDLEVQIDKVRAELAELEKKHEVVIDGNQAKGGNAHKRWLAVILASVANCSSGARRNAYSMGGSWPGPPFPVIRPGESSTQRSDCSETVTAWAWAAGLPDPNGQDYHGGFTGTLVGQHNGWKQVSLEALRKKGWGYIVYGLGSGHHTEAFIGPGDRTGGHGSPPVDFGVIHLFGSGESERYFIYEPED